MQASNPYSPPVQILRRPAVVVRTGLPTRSIYRLMQRGAFPRPVPISALSVGWLAHEIDEWIAGRIAARDAKATARPGEIEARA
jgi:prophage regulatory protein